MGVGTRTKKTFKNYALHLEFRTPYMPLARGQDPERSVVPHSEFPTAYKPYNLHVFRHAAWLTYGAGYMGRRIKPIVEHRLTGLELDTLDDFEIAEALVTARPRLDFLRAFIHDPA